ncbi:MAG: SHOCT domain-containing protein [Actinobacteria bacterium]|nr:SHOCT domain-containing protein [Actinomycetota bacterium]
MIRYGPFLGGWPWLGPVSFLLFWAVVAVGIVLLVRYLSRRGGQAPGPGGPGWHPGPPFAPPPPVPPGMPHAEQILAERFARGEIDEQEYRSRLATLRGEAPGQGSQPPPGL